MMKKRKPRAIFKRKNLKKRKIKKIMRDKKIKKRKKIPKVIKKVKAKKKIKSKPRTKNFALLRGKVLVSKPKKPVLPDDTIHQTKIRIIGIGGGAATIVSEISPDVKRVDFVVANTDTKSLNDLAKKVKRFQFGQDLTKGLGTGMNDELGETAAQNEKEKIKKIFEGRDLCIIVACLGGGTSSGATPVFAKISKNFECLTYGIFTLPFEFEGEKKMEIASKALEKIKSNLNAYSVIPNERIFQIIDKNTPLKNALSVINKKLAENLEGLIEIIYLPGLINIDFADLKTILRGRGRLTYLNTIDFGDLNKEEVQKKLISTSLYPYAIKGARGVLYNISGGKDLQLSQVSHISNIISQSVNKKAKIIFGINQSKKSENKIRITLLATGCGTKLFPPRPKQVPKPPSPKIPKNKQRTTDKKKKTSKAARSKKKQTGISPKTMKVKTKKRQKSPKIEKPILNLNKKPETKKIEVKVRRNGLQLKKAVEQEEKRILEQEKVWETPAILRKKIGDNN